MCIYIYISILYSNLYVGQFHSVEIKCIIVTLPKFNMVYLAEEEIPILDTINFWVNHAFNLGECNHIPVLNLLLNRIHNIYIYVHII